MKRIYIVCSLLLLLTAAAWAQNQPAAKIFVVNSNRTNFYVQVGEDNALAFKYDCPPLSASGILELDSRFFKTYRVYYNLITDSGKRELETVKTYRGEGDPGTPYNLELQGGKIYGIFCGDGVIVYTLVDPPGKEPRICFSNFFMGPPANRIELGKAWGKETALFTGEVRHESITDFYTIKPGTYNFFASHPFFPDKTTVFDKNNKSLSAEIKKEGAYFLFYFYIDKSVLTGNVVDISPVKQTPELFASGKYKVDIITGKNKSSITWELSFKDQKITGISTENNNQYRLEGIVTDDTMKIVCFKEKELIIYVGTKKGKTINGTFRIDLKPANEGAWRVDLP